MKNIGIVGAGTMGRGIAVSSSLSGYQTTVYDIERVQIDSGKDKIEAVIRKGAELGKTTESQAENALAALKFTTDLQAVAATDFVIEAAPENIALKKRIFAELDSLAPPTTILASNTSSLSINILAGATDRTTNFLGLHFFNPVHLMRLVEIIRGDDTSDETLEIACHFIKTLGKVPVQCRDTPGFIVNRVARPFYGEAFRLLGEQAADVPTIDKLVKSAGFRMGPFELIDLVGVDVNFDVSQSVYEAFFQDPKYRPHPIQKRMVESGRLGRKSGRGFYKYDET